MLTETTDDMPPSSALVSIIMSVYNGERYLAEALDSVMAQTYETFELIVVDDGSTDGTAAVVRGFADARVRYVHQPNAGIAAARNRALAMARGGYVTFVDADDRWPADRLQVLYDAIVRADLDIASGHIEVFYSPDLPEAERQRIWHPDAPRPGHLVTAMLIRRDAFDRVGGFETQWRVGIDFTWYARALELGLRIAILPDVVLHRRLHAANYGRQHQDLQREHLHILKAVLDRKRARQAAPTPAAEGDADTGAGPPP